MTPTDWSWLLAIVGTIASVAGVVFSWMAWVQAAKAKDAAREAAEAVRRRLTANEVLRLAGDAKELLLAIERRSTERALSVANAIVQALSLIRSRSSSVTTVADTLKSCIRETMAVAVKLTIEGIPEDRSKLEEVIVASHEIHRKVCDVAGRLEHFSEGAEK